MKKNPGGRPKKPNKMEVLFSVRLPADLLRQVDQRIAEWKEATGFVISRGEAVRVAMKNWVDKTVGV